MKVIDISSKLSNEKPVIKLADGLEFEVDNDKNKVLIMQQTLSSDEGDDIEKFDKIITILLGKKAHDKIESLKYSFADYTTIVKAVMAAATDVDYEEIESRFQRETQ
jgi:hypothetical protein